jgi:hypothetical protein
MKISLIAREAKPPENVYMVNLPRTLIGVLHQMRGRMSEDGLDELAASILQSGQLNPGIVVALTFDAAKAYLGRINEMWGTAYDLEAFPPVFLEEKAESYHLFLVAGHRRLRAVTIAELSTFYCQLRLETEFSKALHLQFQENLHEQVPPDDEARFLSLFWREEKAANPTLTLVSFAKSLGKRPDRIRSSLRFTSLPVSVQRLVLPSGEYKKGVSFGILCELARLQEARKAKGLDYEEMELIKLAYVIIVEHRTAKATAAWVSSQIEMLEGQTDMFELSIQEAVEAARRKVATGYEETVKRGSQHLAIAARFHDAGLMQGIPSQSAVTATNLTLELILTTGPKIIEGLEGGRGARKVQEELREISS